MSTVRALRSADTAGLELAPGLRLPVETVTETLAVIANRGVGKSSTVVVLVEELHDAGQPVVILDPKGDWWGLRHSADGGPGLPFVIFGGDHADVPLEPTAGALLAQVIVEHRLSCVLDLSAMSKSGARRFAMDFAEALYRRNRDPLHVVVDEADVLVPQRASADVARLLGAMEDIAKRGRGRGLGITLISQRAADVSKTVLDLCETLIVMRVTGPRTRAAILGWIDDHDDNADAIRQVISSLKGLQVGEAWVWSPGVLHVLQRVHVREIRTFDSHATPRPGEVRRQPTRAAEVDLAALGEQIAATVERVKADDPKTLRARVAELERELARARTDRPAPVVERVERVEVEVPVLDEALAARLEAAIAPVFEVAEGIQHATDAVSERLGRWQRPAAPPNPTPQAAPAPTPVRPAPPAAAATPAVGPGPRAGARRMLQVLAAHHPMRLTRTQLGTLAKVKHSGGTFTTYFGELKRSGLLEEVAGEISITPAGLDHLGIEAPRPASPEEILQMYRSTLRAGARAMLDALVTAYPAGLSREDLATAAGITASGGTFTTYLGHLRRNGLVEVDGSEVRASGTLFLGASERGA